MVFGNNLDIPRSTDIVNAVDQRIGLQTLERMLHSRLDENGRGSYEISDEPPFFPHPYRSSREHRRMVIMVSMLGDPCPRILQEHLFDEYPIDRDMLPFWRLLDAQRAGITTHGIIMFGGSSLWHRAKRWAYI